MASIIKVRDKYRAQVRRTGYAPQCQTFPTRSAAEKWARELETKMEAGLEIDVAALRKETVGSLLQRFLDSEVPQRKGGRWESVRIASMLANAPFVHHRLHQPLAEPLREWARRRAKEVSPATVNRELNFLSGVFRLAIKKWGLPLAANPVHSVERPRVDSRSKGQLWTDQDLAALRAAVPTPAEGERWLKSHYVVPAIELSLLTAMRLGEVCAISVANLHLDDGWLLLGDSKNGDERMVALVPRAVEILRELLPHAQDGLVVPVSPGTLGTYYRAIRREHGLRPLRYHDTRHTAATRAAAKLDNVLELAAFTGHRSLQSLKRYYHAKPQDLVKKLAG